MSAPPHTPTSPPGAAPAHARQRRAWCTLTALAPLAALTGWPDPAHALEPGDPAPRFVLPGRVGEVDLQALRGRWVYVDFWASWCAPCRLSFPWMAALHERQRDNGLVIVAINVDARQRDATRFLDELPVPFTIAFDPQGRTPKAWDVRTMPTSVLVDREGRVRFIHRGFRHEDRQSLEPRIAGAMAAG